MCIHIDMRMPDIEPEYPAQYVYILMYVCVFMFTNILMRTYMCTRIDARRRTSVPCATYI